ncbi:hypothetical protein OKW30_008026 [Paraburkholderia sp. Clong3]
MPAELRHALSPFAYSSSLASHIIAPTRTLPAIIVQVLSSSSTAMHSGCQCSRLCSLHPALYFALEQHDDTASTNVSVLLPPTERDIKGLHGTFNGASRQMLFIRVARCGPLDHRQVYLLDRIKAVATASPAPRLLAANHLQRG